MASIIPGYKYDIFISYRQKDNKYDGWVTDFVDNLKRELEAAFKEEVSVYFDINPHDGLLETHDVSASLKEKLKCLVFIPILSRTYCDPNSFAWENEFKAFINQASDDKYGMKISLPNGNVANRVLPVRINDLDQNDQKLCESIIGGFLRGVDFIYKSPGVNRPLRSKEENPHDNLNHTIYRDQINKVALAIKDIIESMKIPAAVDMSEKKEVHIKESEAKEKLFLDEVPLKKEKLKSSNHKVKILISGILLILAVFLLSAYYLNHRAKVRWAKEIALPEINELIDKEKFDDAFKLYYKIEKYISKDPEFLKLDGMIPKLTILTDPPGADVYVRKYSDIKGKWEKLGQTPIVGTILTYSTFYLTRIEKDGYKDVLAVSGTFQDTLFRKLFKIETNPPEMVYVDECWDWGNVSIQYIPFKKKYGFFIDRYEVTNKQYKEFVDNGGYSNPEYWKNDFVKARNYSLLGTGNE